MPTHFLRSLPLVAIMLVSGPVAAAADDDPLLRVLDLLPRDTLAFVASFNLDRTGDEIDTALLAMDRGDLLIGSRPLDLVKSSLGLNTGVDDFGAGAAALVRDDDHVGGLVLLVPVLDAKIFLDANFVPGDRGELRQVDGSAWHARELGSHVALARTGGPLKMLAPGSGLGAALKRQAGDDWRRLRRRELIVYAQPEAIWSALDGFDEAGESWHRVPGALLRRGRGVIDQASHLLWAVDIDPLALVVHETVRFRPDSTLAQSSDGGDSAIRPLNALADRPYFLATALDVAGLGGVGGASARTEALGLPALPAWFESVRGVEVGVFAEPAPGGAGLLAETAMILHTDEPEAVADAFLAQLRALAVRADGIDRTVTIEVAPESVGPGVKAFAVQAGPPPPGRSLLDAYAPFLVAQGEARDATRLALEQATGALLLGADGWQGYLGTTPGAVIITGGRRPGLWREAVAAASDQATSLDEGFIVQTMRDWMPRQRDFECYLDAARLFERLRPLARLAGVDPALLPAPLDASLPPVGIASDVVEGGVQSTYVIPSGLIVIGIDRLKAKLDPRGAPPARGISP